MLVRPTEPHGLVVRPDRVVLSIKKRGSVQSLLDQIIDGASDDNMNTVNLLRKVQIAATRVGADDVSSWTRQELAGYGAEAELPAYRVTMTTVTGCSQAPCKAGSSSLFLLILIFQKHSPSSMYATICATAA